MTLWMELEQDGFEQLVWCRDRESDLTAFIAIHSTKRGPALGGCRLWPYPHEEAAVQDAMRLARSMTYKAAAAELSYGGGKAVVIGRVGDHGNAKRFEALGRFIDRLNGAYWTGVDVGTTAVDMDHVALHTPYVTDTTGSLGGTGDWTADMTAYGVYEGIQVSAQRTFGSRALAGRTIAVQGLGKVGWALCRYLHRAGAQLIVTDLSVSLVEQAVREFNALPVAPDRVYDAACEIFAPCALGGVIHEGTIDRLKCRIVAGSANNQLRDPSFALALKQQNIMYAPDYVINAGGVIATAAELDGEGTFRTRSRVKRIGRTLDAIYTESARSNGTTTQAADDFAELRM
ncbi:Glu/Leu/Phe/Val dehydrogenase dimerization region [Paenibacillus curdlanolyticus YK9]|uniref:Glu/Leu/Phe/Val dehydrogenase dimerization region n=1 Tax=Paenibacillus curdlanolyticus YK9 TaxID=717606 RepID=E0IGJ4_9BACL|nr:Glu/Leu/Phe/Val dehydrogenase dimerization domain-containing protein [Paenibacillus curdlanolyticus]EFM08398.1 Glu/Leu/Phe/Val dehydrogenase dimerization region [Paenibacillus curdlanolyticus YK9]